MGCDITRDGTGIRSEVRRPDRKFGMQWINEGNFVLRTSVAEVWGDDHEMLFHNFLEKATTEKWEPDKAVKRFRRV